MLTCPKCGSKNLKVLETRNNKDYPGLYRRRLCKDCDIRFSTLEQYVDFKDLRLQNQLINQCKSIEDYYATKFQM